MHLPLLLIATDKYIALFCRNKLTVLPCFYVINEVFAVCCGVIFKDVRSGKTVIESQAVGVDSFLESLVQKTGLVASPRPGEGGQCPANPPAAPAVTAGLCVSLPALGREVFLARRPLLCRSLLQRTAPREGAFFPSPFGKGAEGGEQKTMVF